MQSSSEFSSTFDLYKPVSGDFPSPLIARFAFCLTLRPGSNIAPVGLITASTLDDYDNGWEISSLLFSLISQPVVVRRLHRELNDKKDEISRRESLADDVD